MKITRVCCQGCGADIEVDESVRFVTCNYCHARLEVVHDQSVTHTRQLDKIERTTDEMAGRIKLLELQNDLERLDREWENRRQSLLITSKQGRVSEPSSGSAIVGGVVVIAFGIFWMRTAVSIGAPSFFPLFGIVFIGFALFGMFNSANKAGAYRNLNADYESRRQQLIDRIDRERRP